MASVPAVQHKERMAKAYAAMEILGLKRKKITPFLNDLLKIYNNEWEFIEAENYRVLADNIFEAQEPENLSRGGGPVTRARRGNSGSDTYDNSDDSLSPPRGSPPRENPPPPPRTRATIQRGDNARPDGLVRVKTEPNSPASGRGADAVATQTAKAVEYHSGSSVRTRAASQILSGSPGARGRGIALDSAAAAAAAHEREKGKSPMRSESRRLQSRGANGLPNHVSVTLEVCSSLPAPEGIEKVAFEKVDGEIRPAVRRPQNEAVTPSKQAEQLTPLTSQVKIDGETLHQQSDPGNEVLAPIPLLAKDPTTNMTVPIKADPPAGYACSPNPSSLLCKDVSLDQSIHGELPVESTLHPSPAHLQIVSYGTVFADAPSTAEQPSTVITGPSIDLAPKFELEERERNVLPVDRSQEDGTVSSQVDHIDDDRPEPAEKVSSGTGCDIVVSDAVLEQAEPRELNDEQIKPNFNVSGYAKPDIVDEQVGAQPQQQLSEPSVQPKATSSTAPPRRRLIIDESQGTPGNEDSDCTIVEGPVTGPSSAGVKRKLIISASPRPEGSGCIAKDTDTSNGIHTMVRTGDTIAIDRCEDRGQGRMNSARNRIKLEPGNEDLNAQRLKHDPRDISRGAERVPIPFVNEFTSETITGKFNYIASNVVYQSAYINISLARIGDEDSCFDCVGNCLMSPHSCPCTRETGGEFAYTKDGRLKQSVIRHELDAKQDNHNTVFCSSGWVCPIERAKTDPSDQSDKCKGHLARKFVKECWHKCSCNMQCGNRVVQRGISRQLEVFFTNDGKGWGLRTAEDLPIGSFVCEYVGEILTNVELDQRNQEAKRIASCGRNGDHKDTYPLTLDGDWCAESGLRDEEALCLDATRYGNVARFINHRCFDANLIDIPVSIEGLDRHYYHVAFFTCRNVRAGEELNWDYKIDFEDDEHPIEAFQCLCKSELCRGGSASAAKKRKK